jgi:formamidopyrimidine-DNA glycosylase
MPELPDIEIYRRYLDSTALYHVIEEVVVEDERIIKDIDPADFAASLTQKELTGVHRHGKYLFISLDAPNTLMFHLGMSGKFSYRSNAEEPPEYEKVAFILSNDYRLSFMNKRMLGQVRLIEDRQAYLEENEIGPDALSDEMDWSYFSDKMDGKRGMVKSALMNQQIISGVGNEFSDEILFQLNWFPKIKVNQLDKNDLEALFEMTKKTLRQGVNSNMEYKLMPGDFLIPHRNNDRICPRCETELERIKVSGRNSTYCPSCQTKGA